MNYPEGVTGMEYEIAGADGHMMHEIERDVCERPLPDGGLCQWSGLIEIEVTYFRNTAWGEYVCPGCSSKVEWEGEI